jgi:hypothetical protein
MNPADRAINLLVRQPKRASIQKNKNAGVAKVMLESASGPSDEGSDHAGMGIIVDPFHMITCAHVINTAFPGREMEQQDPPSGSIKVTFPMLADGTAMEAVVVKWRSPGQRPQDDIAVLKFESAVPEAAGVVPMADVTGMSTDGDALSIFGVAAGHRIGTHIDAKFKGSTSAAWVQLDGVEGEGPFIEGGFSGAAVWDYPNSAVLGMMVAKKVSEQQRVAYMIPTIDVKEFWPDLQVENRPLAPSFARTWTLLSAVYFLLLLAHWAVNRGVSTFSAFTYSGDHKQLAVFYGMHIYAFLAPVILQRLIAFANSFRLHDWVARVPSFGGFAGHPVSSSTSRAAAASLAAFVVLPLIAQIHFIRVFHNKGYVYIYPGSFGYESTDPPFSRERCDRSSIHLCTKSDAGRYSLAAPKPGHTAGYWENAYHYGDRDHGGTGSVTFFPILQPVVISALTVLWTALSALAMYAVFRPTPERAIRRQLSKEIAGREADPQPNRVEG